LLKKERKKACKRACLLHKEKKVIDCKMTWLISKNKKNEEKKVL